VRIFYEYLDDLKKCARRHLGGKARVMPGATAAAQSALLSMLCDLAVQNIPLGDVDAEGRPALWPLLLKYVERHCDKWNNWHQAKKRKGAEVSLSAASGGRTIDPDDYRAPADDEARFGAAFEILCARLTDEERQVLEGRLGVKHWPRSPRASAGQKTPFPTAWRASARSSNRGEIAPGSRSSTRGSFSTIHEMPKIPDSTPAEPRRGGGTRALGGVERNPGYPGASTGASVHRGIQRPGYPSTEGTFMSHSFTNLLYHAVWATKGRHPWLDADIQPPLFGLLGHLVKEDHGIALSINGMPDHVHLLLKLPQDKAVSDVVRDLKARSSFWIHKTYARQEFAWQTGYGLFTVSESQVETVRRYIANQEEHHRKRPFAPISVKPNDLTRGLLYR
jgi:REP element-mobilizing transposase RayT